MRRELQISIDDQPVGTLFENQGIWSLQYTPEWISSGFPLSPKLPLQLTEIVDTGTTRPVQWYFDNLLPEEGVRQQLINAQTAPANGVQPALDAWWLLENYGSESAGALTLLPPDTEQAQTGLRPLLDAELEARIQRMERIPITQEAPKKMSVAGAQQKLLVYVDGEDKLFEPIGRQPSSHLLKPNSVSDFYPHSAVNEWFCARVAQGLKLNVPAVELRYVPSTVYLIQRFDRQVVNGVLRRRHIIDCAQLLSIAAAFKYNYSGGAALRQVIDNVRIKARSRLELFRWVVFNILIGNGDAHLKNLSLFVSRDGYALAPHYDLVSTAAWARPEIVGKAGPAWPNIELSFPVGNATHFADVRKTDLMQLADVIELPKTIAATLLEYMVENVGQVAGAVKAEYLARTDTFDNTRAGELRMINAICEMPVREMTAALSRPK